MKYSVIIQSYLGSYPKAARDRENKIFRAVDSLLNQTFKDFEIIVVADGCRTTVQLLLAKYSHVTNMTGYLVEKQPLWSGYMRNYGIAKASGQYITYLDIDDYWGPRHLEIIDRNIGDRDWVYYDDYSMKDPSKPKARDCKLSRGHCGTSNFTHKRELGQLWDVPANYQHDFKFMQNLLKFKNHCKIQTPEYYCCHVPGQFDV